MNFQEALNTLVYGENYMVAEFLETHTVAGLTKLPDGRYKDGQVTEKRVLTIQLGGRYGRLFAQGQNVVIEMASPYGDGLTTDWEVRCAKQPDAILAAVKHKESRLHLISMEWDVQQQRLNR